MRIASTHRSILNRYYPIIMRNLYIYNYNLHTRLEPYYCEILNSQTQLDKDYKARYPYILLDLNSQFKGCVITV